jgi:hypothetical protein
LKKASVLLVIAIGIFAGNAQAIYKCTTSRGVIYQDRPCKEGTETDVTIVVPTGELAPKPVAAQDDPAQVNAPRADDSRSGNTKTSRTADNPASMTRPADTRNAADTRTTGESTADGSRRQSSDNIAPMTAEQARKAEATAKYYTTDAVAPGTETPEQMTCESPSGVKRRFILTNGLLTSI